MDKYLTNLKMFELQKNFGSDKLLIIDAKRKFLMEDSLFLIEKDLPKSVVCYFLSDMLLVTKLKLESKIFDYMVVAYIHFDQNSFVRSNEDTKYFQDIFTVYGKEGKNIIFSASSKVNKKKFISFIDDNIIEPLREKVKQKEQAFKNFNNSNENYEKSRNIDIKVNIKINFK